MGENSNKKWQYTNQNRIWAENKASNGLECIQKRQQEKERDQSQITKLHNELRLVYARVGELEGERRLKNRKSAMKINLDNGDSNLKTMNPFCKKLVVVKNEREPNEVPCKKTKFIKID